MRKPSKRYRGHEEKVDKDPVELSKAVEILKGFDTTKFDQTVEVHMRLGIDPKQADQLVRGSIVLPHGIGRSQKVIVFARGPAAEAAREAGADEVGEADLASKITGGWFDFDVCIASPDMMGIVGPLGKALGPRGLMPSPRAGTVTPEVAEAVRQYKAGKVEFRNDDGGNIHAVVGRISFEPEKLEENIAAFLNYIESLRPHAAKGVYVKTVVVAATMSPAVYIAA